VLAESAVPTIAVLRRTLSLVDRDPWWWACRWPRRGASLVINGTSGHADTLVGTAGNDHITGGRCERQCRAAWCADLSSHQRDAGDAPTLALLYRVKTCAVLALVATQATALMGSSAGQSAGGRAQIDASKQCRSTVDVTPGKTATTPPDHLTRPRSDFRCFNSMLRNTSHVIS
jgi:hypothetical protein